MRCIGLVKDDCVNGPGVRVSMFVSGCRHKCKHCFNPESWDFNHGENIDGKFVCEIFNELHKEHVAGLSILGGEPLEPENQEAVNEVVRSVKEAYPNKSIWLWTGCVLKDDFTADDPKYNTVYTKKILQQVDYVVDGPFMQENKDLTAKFRGSTNQRIIDVKKSIAAGKIVLARKYMK